ncbi:MAG: PspC domain-containing protein [Dehalococcoidia bacterium]|nr:MAG: PspC domain-containing protein [Dehalococcoidia bacterium]
MTQEPPGDAPSTPPAAPANPRRRLAHPIETLIACSTGLAGGVATHFGVDPILVRLTMVGAARRTRC